MSYCTDTDNWSGTDRDDVAGVVDMMMEFPMAAVVARASVLREIEAAGPVAPPADDRRGTDDRRGGVPRWRRRR
jgi:hypothetical protein